MALGHQFPNFTYGAEVGVYDLRMYVGPPLDDTQESTRHPTAVCCPCYLTIRSRSKPLLHSRPRSLERKFHDANQSHPVRCRFSNFRCHNVPAVVFKSSCRVSHRISHGTTSMAMIASGAIIFCPNAAFFSSLVQAQSMNHNCCMFCCEKLIETKLYCIIRLHSDLALS